MCEPTTWAAIALTAAGSYQQYRGDQMSRRAMDNARLAEAERQKELRSRSDALFKQSLGKSSVAAQQEQLGTAMEKRQNAMQGAQKQQPVANAPVQGGSPKVVSDETSARVSQGNTDASRAAALQAALQGYGDLQFGNSLRNAQFLRDQGTVGNFMTGSQGVLGTELEAASHRGDKLKNVGAGLQAAGQLVGMYGAMSPKSVVPTDFNDLYKGLTTSEEFSRFGGYFPKL